VQWRIGNLTIQAGSKLTHKANTTLQLYQVNIKASGNVDLQSGGNINVDGLGFNGGGPGTDGNGPGGGKGSASEAGGGAGYGGNGGAGQGGIAGGVSYGSLTDPQDLGSGGGGGSGASGGAGGGLIVLEVAGVLTANGTISANGANGVSSGGSGGGGSGGTVNLQAGTLAGSGTIRANGGNGGSASKNGGGGGGGRIAIVPSGLDILVLGGLGGGITVQPGQPGTIFNLDIIPPSPIPDCKSATVKDWVEPEIVGVATPIT